MAAPTTKGPHHTKSRQKRRLPVCSAKSPEECNSSREKRAAKRAKKIEDPEDDVFEVEAIVAHRLKPGTVTTEYLLKWKGYSDSENSWVEESEMSCSKLLSAYHKSVRSNSEKSLASPNVKSTNPTVQPHPPPPPSSSSSVPIQSSSEVQLSCLSDASHSNISAPPAKKARSASVQVPPDALASLAAQQVALAPPTKEAPPSKIATTTKKAPPKIAATTKEAPPKIAATTKEAPPKITATTKEAPPSKIAATTKEAPLKIAPTTKEAPPSKIAATTKEAPPKIAPTTKEAPPSKIAATTKEAPPSKIAPTTKEAPPSKIATTTKEALPSKIAPTTKEALLSKIAATTKEAPPKIAATTKEAPPSKIAPTTKEVPPSKIAPPTKEAPPKIAATTKEAPPKIAPTTKEAPPSKIATTTKEAPPSKIATTTKEALFTSNAAPTRVTSAPAQVIPASIPHCTPAPNTKPPTMKPGASLILNDPPKAPRTKATPTTQFIRHALPTSTTPKATETYIDLTLPSSSFKNNSTSHPPPTRTLSTSSVPSPTLVHSHGPLIEPLSDEQLMANYLPSVKDNVNMTLDNSFQLDFSDDPAPTMPKEGKGGSSTRTRPNGTMNNPKSLSAQDVANSRVATPLQHHNGFAMSDSTEVWQDVGGSRVRGTGEGGVVSILSQCFDTRSMVVEGVHCIDLTIKGEVVKGCQHQNGFKQHNGRCHKVLQQMALQPSHFAPPPSHLTQPPSHLAPPPSYQLPHQLSHNAMPHHHLQPRLPQPHPYQHFTPHLPQPHLPQPHLPQPHLPQPHLPQPHLPQPHLPQPHLPQSHLPQPQLPQPHPFQHFPQPHPPLSSSPHFSSPQSQHSSLPKTLHPSAKNMDCDSPSQLVVSFPITDIMLTSFRKPNELTRVLQTTQAISNGKASSFSSQQQPGDSTNLMEKKGLLTHEAYLGTLMEWQSRINRQCTGVEPPVFVENEVDHAPIPANFTYVVANIYRPGVPDPGHVRRRRRLPGGVSVLPGWEGMQREVKALLPAHGRGTLRLLQEQEDQAATGKRHLRVQLQVHLSPQLPEQGGPEGGWGVKAVCPIGAHTFVSEYVGEVITVEEAEKREQRYDNGVNYLFDLDYYEDHSEFTIDATKYGNVAHFFNHSCNPNLMVYSCWINTADPRLPRLAFFTTRSIAVNEELTFDYQMNRSEGSAVKQQHGKIPCLCGTSNCTGFVY
eukprot:Em0001g1292a